MSAPLGVVEGFYGPLWSLEDRLSVVDFASRIGMKIYIYGPKWDPYHRKFWRNPYPPKYLDELRTFVDWCLKLGIEPVIAISPGLDIDYSSERDIAMLVRKLEEFLEMGVRTLALFLDDIPPTLRGKGFKTLAEAQAYLANRVVEALSPDKLIMCPTHYYGYREPKYLEELGKLLDPKVELMWTGMFVCSPTIKRDDVEGFERITGRKPFIWDNYPVNDYFTCRGITRLHLAPIKGRDPDLLSAVSGYTLNPANQVECSKIVLYTASELFLGGSSYDPRKALKEGIARVVNRSARFWFERFVEFNKAAFFDLDEKEINECNADEALEIVKNLRESLSIPKLLAEVEPVLNKMEAIARYAKGETRYLSWRVQTAGEYNPPLPRESMEKEMFGCAPRRIPWYAKAYPTPEWW